MNIFVNRDVVVIVEFWMTVLVMLGVFCMLQL